VPRRGTLLTRTAICVVVTTVTASSVFAVHPRARAAGPPDIIVIVTDDQRADTLRSMPRTRESLPTRFVNAFVSNASCCASRTTMFTGTYSHTNGVWTNGDGKVGSLRREFGGWRRYSDLQLDRASVALALQHVGYRTGHFGKFLNLFNATSLDELPVGWNEFLAVGTGRQFAKEELSPYYEYSLVGIGDDGRYVVERHGTDPADHSTRVVTNHAVDYIGTMGNEPMFLHVGYPAPHARSFRLPPVPLPRDVNADIDLPRLAPSVNEADVSDKPRFVAKGDIRDLREINRWRRAVARSLLGVDRGVDAILEAQNERDPGLENTLVIFVSDNGRLDGEHRWAGKGIGYEEAIKVPLLVRWAGAPAGAVTSMVANLDIARTIAQVSGMSFGGPDSMSLLDGGRRSVVLEGLGGDQAYCGVRTEARKYVKYASGDVEYYNLRRDPYELRNRPETRAARELHRLARSLCASNLPPGWPTNLRY
jgi:N-acetylglucosamine-6-sulfatase